MKGGSETPQPLSGSSTGRSLVTFVILGSGRCRCGDIRQYDLLAILNRRLEARGYPPVRVEVAGETWGDGVGDLSGLRDGAGARHANGGAEIVTEKSADTCKRLAKLRIAVDALANRLRGTTRRRMPCVAEHVCNLLPATMSRNAGTFPAKQCHECACFCHIIAPHCHVLDVFRHDVELKRRGLFDLDDGDTQSHVGP